MKEAVDRTFLDSTKKGNVCTEGVHGECESALYMFVNTFLCQQWSIVLFGGTFFMHQLWLSALTLAKFFFFTACFKMVL